MKNRTGRNRLVATTSLLTATLKFACGHFMRAGPWRRWPLSPAVINGNNQHAAWLAFRATSLNARGFKNAGWQRLSGDHHCCRKEGERYQGVVAGLKAIPGGVPEDYSCAPEQLPTRLFIRYTDADGKPGGQVNVVSGDAGNECAVEDFDHLAISYRCPLKAKSCLSLPANDVLWRLQHEAKKSRLRSARC